MVETNETAGKRRRERRSLLWAVVLVALGVVWLLGNLDIIPNFDWRVIVNLWPLLLVLAGLDLIFTPRWPVLGAIVGLLVVGAVVVAVVRGVGPEPVDRTDSPLFGFPWGDSVERVELNTYEYSAPIEQAGWAEVDVELGRFRAFVDTLPADSEHLIDARVSSYGDVVFEVTGAAGKSVVLAEDAPSRTGLDIPIGEGNDLSRYTWGVHLTPLIPLDLTIDAGPGNAELDLKEVDLDALAVNGNSGALSVILPTGDRYPFALDVSSGSVSVAVENGAAVDMTLDGGPGAVEFAVGEGADVTLNVEMDSGALTVSVPEGAAVQLTAEDEGPGGIDLPDYFELVESDPGVWQTPDYAGADVQIAITIEEAGPGPVMIRER